RERARGRTPVGDLPPRRQAGQYPLRRTWCGENRRFRVGPRYRPARLVRLVPPVAHTTRGRDRIVGLYGPRTSARPPGRGGGANRCVGPGRRAVGVYYGGATLPAQQPGRIGPRSAQRGVG